MSTGLTASCPPPFPIAALANELVKLEVSDNTRAPLFLFIFIVVDRVHLSLQLHQTARKHLAGEYPLASGCHGAMPAAFVLYCVACLRHMPANYAGAFEAGSEHVCIPASKHRCVVLFCVP